MKKVLFFLVLLCMEKALHAQTPRTPYIYKIKADSVLITNSCDTAELIIENHTQTVPGFLFNKGRGGTEFRSVLQKISDTLVTIGPDTLRIPYAWVQGGNRWNTTGVFGTMDNNPIDFYTNSTRQGRWTNTGNLLLGSITDTGNYKLNVNGMLRAGLNSVIGAPDDQGITGNETGLKVIGNLQVVTAKSEGANGGLTVYKYGWGRPGATAMSLNNFNVIAYDGTIQFAEPNSRYFSVNAASNAGLYGGPVTRTKYTIGSSSDPTGYNDSYATFGVSDKNEFSLDYNYPSRANYYMLETRLNGATVASNTNQVGVRAPLRIGARQIWFYTGDGTPGAEAARFTETGNLLIGTEYVHGDKLQVNGDAWITQTQEQTLNVSGKFIQGYHSIAQMGNGIQLDEVGTDSRILAISGKGIVYEANSGGDHHYFRNVIGKAFKGTFMTLDPGIGDTAMPANQITFKVRCQNAADFAITLNGYTGIGTLNPSAQLHTTGTVRFAGLTNNNSLTHVVVADANGNLYYKDMPSAFNGTLNSDLAVNGAVSAQKMLISQTGRWPDYVFSNQYKLPSLTEVEHFINQNNHLPGVPSAAEVEKKGIDVAGNQAVLLKKIEELTLYAIEQDKEMKKQSEEISRLKKQNSELESLKQQMAELKALIINARQSVK